MTKLFLLVAMMFSFSAHALWGSKAEEKNTAGKSKRQINQSRALGLCSSISEQDTSSWCKALVYNDSYFQDEALNLCEKNGGDTLQFCIEAVRNRKYEGLYLESLKSCAKFSGHLLAVRGTYWTNGNFHRVDYDTELSGCLANLNKSIPKSSAEITKYDLPDNTQLTIPVTFVTPAGKTCAPIQVSDKQDLTCEACVKLNKDELRNDNAFSVSVLEIKDSKFSVSSDSIKLEIVNHNYITSVTCGGLATPNGQDRKAVENYFGAGGLKLQFPAPVLRN